MEPRDRWPGGSLDHRCAAESGVDAQRLPPPAACSPKGEHRFGEVGGAQHPKGASTDGRGDCLRALLYKNRAEKCCRSIHCQRLVAVSSREADFPQTGALQGHKGNSTTRDVSYALTISGARGSDGPR